MSGPSQAQIAGLKGLQGLFGGLASQDAAQRNADLKMKYLEANQHKSDPYKQALVDYRNKKLAQDALKKPAGGGTPQRFDANSTASRAKVAFERAAGLKQGESYDELEPERVKSGNLAAKQIWFAAARASNQKNQAFGANYAVPEESGDYITQSEEAVPGTEHLGGLFTTGARPPKYAPNPKWGYSAGGSETKSSKGTSRLKGLGILP